MFEHLRSNGMTYWEHFRFATGHAGRCLQTAFKLTVHAIYPSVWQRAGRKLVRRMLRDFDVLDNNY